MNRLRISAARVLSMAGVCGLLLVGGVVSASADTASLSASGNGTQEVPPAAASDSMAATVDIDPQAGTITYTVSFQGSEPAVAAHIHKGEAGVSGPVVVPLDEAVVNASGTATVTVDKSLAAAIVAAPGDYYVNVHTASYPAGAARGQLGAGAGTVPTAVNAGTGGQYAAGNNGLGAPAIALLVGAALVIVGATGAFTVRRRNI